VNLDIPNIIDVSATHIERAPVTLALWGIVLLMAIALIWVARKLIPWIDTRTAAAQAHTERMVTTRGKEAQEDLQAHRELATAQMQVVTKEIGAKVESVQATVLDIQRDLLRALAKTSVIFLLFGSLAVGTGSHVIAGEAPGCNKSNCPAPKKCSGGVCTDIAKKPQPHSMSADVIPGWWDSSFSSGFPAERDGTM